MRQQRQGRLAWASASERDRIETVQALLVGVLADVDELILRNGQALRRSELVWDVLSPSQERLTRMRAEIMVAAEQLATHYAEQVVRWHEVKDSSR